MNEPEIRIAKETEYLKLLDDPYQTIGVSHHRTGLGKLKVVDNGGEYGIPVADLLEPLKLWRIDKG